MKSKSHQVLVSVTFDKPCSKAFAVAAVRDCVHGEFYPATMAEHEPEEFLIRSVRAPKQAKNK